MRPAFPDAEETPRDRIDVLLEQVQVGGMALSVGVVWWASRVSGLLGSLLASAPAWRHIDPLPVVGRDEDEDKKWYDHATIAMPTPMSWRSPMCSMGRRPSATSSALNLLPTKLGKTKASARRIPT